jgi:hypothetical protein
MVSGHGCAGGESVRFELYDPDPDSSVSTVANNNGTFAQLIRVPAGAHVGRAWLRASCRTPESGERILQAPLSIAQPPFVITWTNVLFGFGVSLMVAGFLLALRRRVRGRGYRGLRSRH